jgi:pyruvate formate-lyase/glycerol dehydratase family glycyl radical enzyme
VAVIKERTMPLKTLEDISLKEFELTPREFPRVFELRGIYMRARPEICIERADLVTKFSREHGLFKEDRISILDKARLYRHVLETRSAIVRHSQGYESNGKGMEIFRFKDSQLFAGSTTSKFKGVPLYPEFLAPILWPELWSVSKRASNPFQITKEEVEALNYDIFPHWINYNIRELTRKRGCHEEMKLHELLVFFLASKVECISHTIPDFSRAIGKGLGEMINDAERKKAATPDTSKKQFYEAISEVLEGVITYSKKLAAKANTLADKETDPIARDELRKIAAIHRRVPENPAQTFREGLTTLWICWTAIHLENPNLGLSLGRLDQVLDRLYQQDIQRGDLDIKGALELLCCLWLKIGDHVPLMPQAGEQLFGGTGSNQAITIGGVDKNGKDAVNDLTYVVLKSIELMKLRDPNLNARYHPKENSDGYLKRLCEANINTKATPAIHNDKAVIKALMAKGDNIEQARDYGIVGCVEPTSSGRTYGACASILLNLTSALELALFNGRHRHTHRHIGMDKKPISYETGDPTTFKNFPEFKKAFAKQTQWLVDKAINLNNMLGKVHQDFYPTPILSAFFEGPMDNGMDLIQGGAKINSSGATIIGLADVADSLTAIETVVFGEENPISFADLLRALRRDFEGDEPLLKRLREKAPKYGNDDRVDSVAHSNVRWLLQILDEAFGGKNEQEKEEKRKDHYRGGHYRVGYWTMTSHAAFGRLMGATPNGRKAGENFASGLTPVSGVAPELLKVINSVAMLPAERLSSGVALNLKFTPDDRDREGMLREFITKVKSCFDDHKGKRDGGMEIQFNITRHEDFEEAYKNPNAHPELLVRVSGYTAFFKDLNPQMQVEIINRTEYQLSTGKARLFPLAPLPKQPA